jgi:serine/threonine protein kinase
MSETSEIHAGSVLGDTYEVTELIGEGGMGTVWSAKHLRLPGKRVAVKVLHGVAAADREAFARFRREAEIATKIGHPNIVQVHDFNVLASGTPYLVLEFLDGEDLAHRLERGPIALDATLSITRQIGSALQAAHKADVVHRDLKPGNIFLIPTEIGGELVDQAKVLDFGISKIRNSQTVQTQDSLLLGTPQYMAPEQALGKNSLIDARTDVFALGAIVYEMLAGRPAFVGTTLAEVVFKVVYEQPAPLAQVAPDVPAQVIAAIDQALAKDQGQRFDDVGAFVTALTGRPLQTLDRLRAAGTPLPQPFSASGQPSPAIPPTALQPPAGGSKAAIFVGAALLVLVAGGVALMQLLKPPAAPVVPKTSEIVAALPAQKVEPPAQKVDPTAQKVDPTAQKVEPPPAQKAEPTAQKVEPTTPPPSTTIESKSTTKPVPVRPDKKETLSLEVAAQLDSAEKAIDGSPAEAVRLARNTLTTAKSGRAYSIITRAFCKQGDLGNAKANLHNVGGDRARVVKYCRAAGTDLQ